MPGRAPARRTSAASAGHVAELFVAAVPGAGARLVRAATGLPPVVDHDERADSRRPETTRRCARRPRAPYRRCSFRTPSTNRCCHRVGSAEAVALRPAGAAGAHLSAERVERGERRLSLSPGATHDVADVERAVVEPHADAAAAHVGPQADALRDPTCQKQNELAPVRTPYACVSDPSNVAQYHGITRSGTQPRHSRSP